MVHADEMESIVDSLTGLTGGRELEEVFSDIRTYHVDVNFQMEKNHDPPGRVNYDSLIHLWSEWYEDYLDLPTPRVMVRYEDVLFYQEEVARDICNCVEGEWFKPFGILEKSAKGEGGSHKRANGREDALARYTDMSLREEGFYKLDSDFAKIVSSDRLKKIFNYL